MTYREKLLFLKDSKYRTDERLSVALGERLGGDGPSARSISRWRRGEARPSRVYQNVLDSLYDEHKNKKEKR